MPRTSKTMDERLKTILQFVITHLDQYGYPPTIRDIGKKINVSSTSQVSYYLNKLEREQYIDRSDHISRSIRVSSNGYDLLGLSIPDEISEERRTTVLEKIESIADSLWNIPKLGRIVASEPLPMPDDPTFDPDDTIEVARSLFGLNENPKNLFALEVDGDSMIDAMINDGDIVIFRKQDSVNNGEMAAIWIDDDSATTLKYYFKEKDHHRLKPANPTMDDIIIPARKHVRIMGKVVAVMRQVSTAA